MGDLTADDLRSVRNLATNNGVRYYVAESANKRTACITGYPENSPKQWFTGCGELSGTDREIVTVSMNGVATAVLVPNNLAATDALTIGYERLHTNIYVVENTGQSPGS